MQMELNKKLAKGVHVVGDDYEFIKAVRRPNVNTKITHSFYFKGKASFFKKKKQE